MSFVAEFNKTAKQGDRERLVAATKSMSEAPSVRSYADLQKKLKPGDIIVTSMSPRIYTDIRKTPVGYIAESAYRAASKKIQGDHSHVGLYVGGGKMLELRRTSGVTETPLRGALKHLDAQVVRPQVSKTEKKQAIQRARRIMEEGAEYDLKAFPKVVAASFKKTKGEPLKERIRQNKLICSTLVQKSFARTKFTKDKDKELIIPADFVESPKVSPVATFKNPGRRDRPKTASEAQVPFVSEFNKEAKRCWEGYEPVPGKKPYSDDSCRKKGTGSKDKKKTSAEKKPLKDPEGGLTAAGRKAYERSGESKDLKPGVKERDASKMSPEQLRRKGSWATRFYGQKDLPPLKKPNGEPTRLALTAKAWGEPVPQNESDARRIAAKGRALLDRYKGKEKDAEQQEVLALCAALDL